MSQVLDGPALTAAVCDVFEGTCVPATPGGCWYCRQTTGELRFSWEFDTHVHAACLRAARAQDPDDPEARIMDTELLQSLTAESGELQAEQEFAAAQDREQERLGYAPPRPDRWYPEYDE